MMFSSSTVNRPRTMFSSTLQSLLRLVSISMLWIPFRHVGSFQQSMHPLPRPSPPMNTHGCTLRAIGIHRFYRCDSLLNLSSSDTPSEESNSKHTIRWEKMFGLLSSYKEREGHTNVPQKHKEGGENLGIWLGKQRAKYKAMKLQPERQSKLESLGVELQTKARSKTSWDEMFDLLCIFKEREGHVNVHQNHKEGGENLGRWLADQRRSDRKPEAERQSKLESLGVELQTKARSKTSWEEMFDLLCIFKEREGHVNVHQNHKEGGENLGRWLADQRRSDRKPEAERQSKLESLGVELQTKARSKTSWEEMFDLLCIYKEREGHANVPTNHKEGGENLGTWLMNQRTSYKTGKLQPDRQSKLESLGVKWQMKTRSKASWEEMFDLLCKFKEREGHANVPQKHKEGGENLGMWLSTQRHLRKTGELQPERQSKLESLGVRSKLRRRDSQVSC